MDVVFGTSSKGKQTVINRNFEYVKERENRCGPTSWRCHKFQSMQCKARLVTSGDCVLSNGQPEHSELCEHYVNSVVFVLCVSDCALWTLSEQHTLTNIEFFASYTLSIIVNMFTVFVLFHSYARWNVARLSVARLTVAAVNCHPD